MDSFHCVSIKRVEDQFVHTTGNDLMNCEIQTLLRVPINRVG